MTSYITDGIFAFSIIAMGIPFAEWIAKKLNKPVRSGVMVSHMLESVSKEIKTIHKVLFGDEDKDVYVMYNDHRKPGVICIDHEKRQELRLTLELGPYGSFLFIRKARIVASVWNEFVKSVFDAKKTKKNIKVIDLNMKYEYITHALNLPVLPPASLMTSKIHVDHDTGDVVITREHEGSSQVEWSRIVVSSDGLSCVTHEIDKFAVDGAQAIMKVMEKM